MGQLRQDYLESLLDLGYPGARLIQLGLLDLLGQLLQEILECLEILLGLDYLETLVGLLAP